MNAARRGCVIVVIVAWGLAAGCGGGKAAGTQGGPCYGNGTCNVGLACVSQQCIDPNATGGTSGGAGTNGTGGAAGASACKGLSPAAQSCMSTTVLGRVNPALDILFMVDNSSSMGEMQQKLYAQLPNFMNVLESLPTKPSLHVAVVSSDMGAPGDSTSSIGCTSTGDQGQFQSMPRGTCINTTLQSGETFISDDGAGGKDYTDPNGIGSVLQCIALLGDKGCGFEHQLASIDRALGADGSSPPGNNAGFLRPDANLGIVILTNEDDCSAPTNTELYSLVVGGSNQQNIGNALGPVANYRCNQFGHLCRDSGGNQVMPPLSPPNGATTLDLTACVSNDTSTGLLTPVSKFVNDIKALKVDPDNQILVAAITGPTAPYTVTWVPEQGGQNTKPGELWPQVEHSCGAAGGDDVNPEAVMHPDDGSFADPGVRITQFVTSFQDSFVASICDASYASSMAAIATKLGQLLGPLCIPWTVQNDANGNPDCSVTENVENNNAYVRTPISNCATNGNQAPCWQLAPSSNAGCTGRDWMVNDSPQNATAQNVNFTLSCSVCVAGSTQTGCP